MLYRALSAPITVQLELTTRCNNRCPHCYNYWRQTDDADTTMTLSQLETVMQSLVARGVFGVTVTGGEPLLYPELVVAAVSACAHGGITCSINSNLTLLNEELLNSITESGSFSFLTSIASHNEVTHDRLVGRQGAFRGMLRGVELLKASGRSFTANMVLSQENASQVYETGVFAHSIGARTFAATKASPPAGCPDYSAIRPTVGQIKQSLDDLLRLRENLGINVDILECYPLCLFGDIKKYETFARRSCTAGVTTATVGADGQVRPCSHSCHTYGNILEEDLTRIYSRMTKWRSGELLPDTCRKCDHLKRCSGGCRCEAEYYGRINDMDPSATLPEDVKLAEHKERRQVRSICSGTLLTVSKELRLRDEDFGSVIRKGRHTMFLDDEATVLVKELRGKGLTFCEIQEKYKCTNEELTMLLDRMIEKEFLVVRK